MCIFSLYNWVLDTLACTPEEPGWRVAQLVRRLLAEHKAFTPRSLERFHGFWEAVIRELLRATPTASSTSLLEHYRVSVLQDHQLAALKDQRETSKKHPRMEEGIALSQTDLRVGGAKVEVEDLGEADAKQKGLLTQPVPTQTTLWIGRCNQPCIDVICFDYQSGKPSASASTSAAAPASAASRSGRYTSSLICVQLKFSEPPALSAESKTVVDADLVPAFKKWLAFYPQLSKHFRATFRRRSQ